MPDAQTRRTLTKMTHSIRRATLSPRLSALSRSSKSGRNSRIVAFVSQTHESAPNPLYAQFLQPESEQMKRTTC